MDYLTRPRNKKKKKNEEENHLCLHNEDRFLFLG